MFIPDIGLGVRVFANGPGDLLNTQHYKVRIKGKVAIEKGAFGLPSTMVAIFTYLYVRTHYYMINSATQSILDSRKKQIIFLPF